MQDMTDFINQVKRANDIVDVIGNSLELRRSGANFVARCPFHGERTPSFHVNRNKQIFKCFGCGEAGDVIGFVQKYESCSFMEALEILAKRAGLKMPENISDEDHSQEKKKRRDRLLSVLRETAVFYWRMFYSSVGANARRYMENRGFSAETLKTFGVGYSPDYNSLPDYLTKKGFTYREMADSGVVQQRQDGSCFDALAGRLIVPIFNINNQVIAFGGRSLEKNPQFGKYKNTSDTEVFSKKNNLFAINNAKKIKQTSGLQYLVMVEGYMDVLAMWQAGFTSVVASMGTSLTEQQAKLLSRLTDRAYICYDGDSAGQKATVRGLDILAKEGLEVRVMSIPENLDPDEYIGKYGKESFAQLLDKALPLADYKLKLLEQAFDIKNTNAVTRNDAISRYVKGALKVLSEMDDAQQQQYVKTVSVKSGFSEDYLKRKLAAHMRGEPVVVQQPVDTEMKALQFIASCMLCNQPYAKVKVPQCDDAFLSGVFRYIEGLKGADASADMVYTVCPDATTQQYDSVLSHEFSKENYQKDKQYFAECMSLVKEHRLKQRRSELLEQLKTADEIASESLLEEIQKINKQING